MSETLEDLTERLRRAINDDDNVYAGRYTDAINNATREIYPGLYKPLEDKTLITGNILPGSHFEDWAVTTYPDLYLVSVVTAVEDTTYIRGGVKSAIVTRAGSDGYMYISETEYPRLLDLMGQTITFKCWVKASTADQAYIEVYTKQADGTEQDTLISDAHSGDGEYELIELEDQELNDDLISIQFRFHVKTSAGDVYFDNARVTGGNVYEYLLPTDFRNGRLDRVWVQTSGYSDDPCDDLQPLKWDEVHFKEIQNSSYKYLQLPKLYTSNRQLRLLGGCPLEELSASTDTMSIEDLRVNLLIAYAAYLLFEMERGIPSSGDVSRFERLSAYWWGKYQSLSHLRMSRPTSTLKLPLY